MGRPPHQHRNHQRQHLPASSRFLPNTRQSLNSISPRFIPPPPPPVSPRGDLRGRGRGGNGAGGLPTHHHPFVHERQQQNQSQHESGEIVGDIGETPAFGTNKWSPLPPNHTAGRHGLAPRAIAGNRQPNIAPPFSSYAALATDNALLSQPPGEPPKPPPGGDGPTIPPPPTPKAFHTPPPPPPPLRTNADLEFASHYGRGGDGGTDQNELRTARGAGGEGREYGRGRRDGGRFAGNANAVRGGRGGRNGRGRGEEQAPSRYERASAQQRWTSEPNPSFDEYERHKQDESMQQQQQQQQQNQQQQQQQHYAPQNFGDEEISSRRGSIDHSSIGSGNHNSARQSKPNATIHQHFGEFRVGQSRDEGSINSDHGQGRGRGRRGGRGGRQFGTGREQGHGMDFKSMSDTGDSFDIDQLRGMDKSSSVRWTERAPMREGSVGGRFDDSRNMNLLGRGLGKEPGEYDVHPPQNIRGRAEFRGGARFGRSGGRRGGKGRRGNRGNHFSTFDGSVYGRPESDAKDAKPNFQKRVFEEQGSINQDDDVNVLKRRREEMTERSGASGNKGLRGNSSFGSEGEIMSDFSLGVPPMSALPYNSFSSMDRASKHSPPPPQQQQPPRSSPLQQRERSPHVMTGRIGEALPHGLFNHRVEEHTAHVLDGISGINDRSFENQQVNLPVEESKFFTSMSQGSTRSIPPESSSQLSAYDSTNVQTSMPNNANTLGPYQDQSFPHLSLPPFENNGPENPALYDGGSRRGRGFRGRGRGRIGDSRLEGRGHSGGILGNKGGDIWSEGTERDGHYESASDNFGEQGFPFRDNVGGRANGRGRGFRSSFIQGNNSSIQRGPIESRRFNDFQSDIVKGNVGDSRRDLGDDSGILEMTCQPNVLEGRLRVEKSGINNSNWPDLNELRGIDPHHDRNDLDGRWTDESRGRDYQQVENEGVPVTHSRLHANAESSGFDNHQASDFYQGGGISLQERIDHSVTGVGVGNDYITEIKNNKNLDGDWHLLPHSVPVITQERQEGDELDSNVFAILGKPVVVPESIHSSGKQQREDVFNSSNIFPRQVAVQTETLYDKRSLDAGIRHENVGGTYGRGGREDFGTVYGRGGREDFGTVGRGRYPRGGGRGGRAAARERSWPLEFQNKPVPLGGRFNLDSTRQFEAKPSPWHNVPTSLPVTQSTKDVFSGASAGEANSMTTWKLLGDAAMESTNTNIPNVKLEKHDASFALTPPKPSQPSSFKVALNRLLDLEAQMEYAFAKHMALMATHLTLRLQYETLEKLPVGIEAVQEELDKVKVRLEETQQLYEDNAD